MATTVGATNTLSGISGGTTTINAGSTFYYDGAGSANLVSRAPSGTSVVGDGTTAATLFLTGAGSPLVSNGVTTVKRERDARSPRDRRLAHHRRPERRRDGLEQHRVRPDRHPHDQRHGDQHVLGLVKDNGTALNVVLGSGYTGTQVFSNAATPTSAAPRSTAGTLSVSKLANGGTVSGIGKSTNAATNLVLNGAPSNTPAPPPPRTASSASARAAAPSTPRQQRRELHEHRRDGLQQPDRRAHGDAGRDEHGLNTVAATIGDNSGATSLTKSGAGTWRLTGRTPTRARRRSTRASSWSPALLGRRRLHRRVGASLGGAGGTITASGVTVASGGGLNISAAAR